MQKKIPVKVEYTQGRKFVVRETMEMAEITGAPDKDGAVIVTFTKYLPGGSNESREVRMSQENIGRLDRFFRIEFVSQEEYKDLSEIVRQMYIHATIDNPPTILLKSRFFASGFSSGLHKAIEALKNQELKSRKEIIDYLRNLCP